MSIPFSSLKGGTQVGDYLSTERTKDLIVADGRDIFGYGYTQLEPVIGLSEKVDEVDTVDNNNASRAFYLQASGRLGYRGLDDSASIQRIDFSAGVVTNLSVPADATAGFYDGCGTDIGDRLFFVGTNGTTDDDLFCYVSENGGASWTSNAIFTSGWAVSAVPDATDEAQVCLVQCDPLGATIRVLVMVGNPAQTAVLESTDGAGAVWNEILLPRQTFNSNSSEGQGAISRDLSTTVMHNLINYYVSVGGTGVFADKASSYPGDIAAQGNRTAISDDGEVLCTFNVNTILANKIKFYVSGDAGDSWLEMLFKLNIPTDRENQSQILSMRFDPKDSNILYAVVGSGFIAGTNDNGLAGVVYKLDVFNFTAERIGELSPSSLIVKSDLIHQRTSLSANNAGISLGFQDPANVDTDFAIEITEGKLILDTTDLPDPLKLFTGPQVEGLGFSWDRLSSPTNVDFLCGYVSADKTTIVGGGSSMISRSGDSGATFTLPTHGFTTPVQAIDGADDASLVVGSGSGQARRSTDGGVNWAASAGLSRAGTGIDDVAHVCSCIAAGTTVLVGFRGGELDVSTDSGANFALLDTPFSASPNTKLRSGTIAKGNDQIIFVGNEDGLIKRSVDGGSSFVDPTTPPASDPVNNIVFEIVCSSDGATVVAIISTQAFISFDTGDTWAEVAVGFSKPSYRGATISDDGSVIMLTNGDGLLVRSIDSGANFYKTLVPWEATRRAAKGVELSPDGALAYCLTNDGLIYRTT